MCLVRQYLLYGRFRDGLGLGFENEYEYNSNASPPIRENPNNSHIISCCLDRDRQVSSVLLAMQRMATIYHQIQAQ